MTIRKKGIIILLLFLSICFMLCSCYIIFFCSVPCTVVNTLPNLTSVPPVPTIFNYHIYRIQNATKHAKEKTELNELQTLFIFIE